MAWSIKVGRSLYILTFSVATIATMCSLINGVQKLVYPPYVMSVDFVKGKMAPPVIYACPRPWFNTDKAAEFGITTDTVVMFDIGFISIKYSGNI